MRRSIVSVLTVLIAVTTIVSVAHGVPREEIVLTTIIPDQQVLIVKKGVVGNTYRRACAADPDNYVQNNNLLIEGNVGIGTTAPTQKLEVNGGVKIGNTTSTSAGTIRWTGTAFEGYTGTAWIPLGGAGGFGEWIDVTGAASGGTVQARALTDGIVIAYGGNDGRINGYTSDSSTNPTKRLYSFHYANGEPSITMPVKKGHYWRVTIADASFIKIWWLPSGD